MSSQKALIAVSGATSFTGVWIAAAFRAAGYRVAGLVTRARAEEYSGLPATRLERLARQADVHFSVRAEDGSMARWIARHRPEIWVHHHHFMENFRSPDYDAARAREVSLTPLEGLMRALSAAECRGVIQSGTYFEPGEGGQPPDAPALTPYAGSKKATWEKLIELCRKHELPLSKVVIPNPIGPFENEDRLIPLLIRNAHSGTPLTLHAPGAASDNLSVFDLADAYVRLVNEVLSGKPARISRPSGWVTTTKDFVARINETLIARELRLTPCPVVEKNPPSPGHSFSNPLDERIPFSLPAFARVYARELQN